MAGSRKKSSGRTKKPTRTTKLDTAKLIAIYDVMKTGDDFNAVARRLHLSLRNAARNNPGQPRALYLDIDGHRNSKGGFDDDAYEIQIGFILGLLSPWLTEIHMPLFDGADDSQREDIPEEISVLAPGPNREADLRAVVEATGMAIFDPETGGWYGQEGR